MEQAFIPAAQLLADVVDEVRRLGVERTLHHDERLA
jgi:hypothetical protein